LLGDMPVPMPPQIAHARSVAMARQQLLIEFGALTDQDIVDLADVSADVLSGWRNRDVVFGISIRERTYYPGFQFDDSVRPLPVIREIVELLKERRGPWELALWFIGTNGWIGGERPVDLLTTSPERVIEAARHEAEDRVF
jgi:hypothetical protein